MPVALTAITADASSIAAAVTALALMIASVLALRRQPQSPTSSTPTATPDGASA